MTVSHDFEGTKAARSESNCPIDATSADRKAHRAPVNTLISVSFISVSLVDDAAFVFVLIWSSRAGWLVGATRQLCSC
jgi:hypothetical protein